MGATGNKPVAGAPASAKSTRLLPLDALRGIIIVVMALDHANSLIAHGKLEFELWATEYPDYGGAVLTFLTRWVTHLAAPGFFFLMGVGMVLFAASRQKRGWRAWQITRHFLVRGLLLIFLQFALENPAWRIGNAAGPLPYFGVLYGLGGAMLLGILLLRVPRHWLLALGLLLIASTEGLLPDPAMAFGGYPSWMALALAPGYSALGGGIWVLYPVFPWLGVLGVGMSYGRWLHEDKDAAYRGAQWLGGAALALFVAIRLLDGFGNIRPMMYGDGWISFLNAVKYPPSITFLLMTLGLDLLLLALFAKFVDGASWFLRGLAVFGRVPLFFYLVHLYLYAFVGGRLYPAGIPILKMYPYWLLGLVVLYPLCLWYGKFKHNRPPSSFGRFF